MNASDKRRVTACLMAVLVPLLLVFQPALPQSATNTDTSRFQEQADSVWQLAARKYGVEAIDLYAIALKESRRRRPDGFYRAWPWTLNSKVTGPLFFETYEAAARKLNEIIAAGETNVDIGLMGINWHYNGHRASDPATLLLPRNNIQVGAQIYGEHLSRFAGDRRRALAHYHSARKERGVPYAASAIAIADYFAGVGGVHLALTN